MANVTLGKVAPTPKGEWNGALEYEKLDIVTNSTTHKVYMAIQNVPANMAITNNEYWEILGIQSSDAEIDDTAGDGDINKVWSANKSYDEITDLKNASSKRLSNVGATDIISQNSGKSVTRSGVTATVDDNYIILNGTSTGTIRIKFSNELAIASSVQAAWREENIDLIEGHDYVFRITKIGGSVALEENSYSSFVFYDHAAGSAINGIYNFIKYDNIALDTEKMMQSLPFTYDPNTLAIGAIYISTGITFTNYKILLEAIDLTIANPELKFENFLQKSKINLFNVHKPTYKTSIGVVATPTPIGIKLSLDGTSTYQSAIYTFKLKPNTKYTFSCKMADPTDDITPWVGFKESVDNGQTYPSANIVIVSGVRDGYDDTISYTFTTVSGYVLFNLFGSDSTKRNGETYFYELMLNEGDKAQPFEPYYTVTYARASESKVINDIWNYEDLNTAGCNIEYIDNGIRLYNDSPNKYGYASKNIKLKPYTTYEITATRVDTIETNIQGWIGISESTDGGQTYPSGNKVIGSTDLGIISGYPFKAYYMPTYADVRIRFYANGSQAEAFNMIWQDISIKEVSNNIKIYDIQENIHAKSELAVFNKHMNGSTPTKNTLNILMFSDCHAQAQRVKRIGELAKNWGRDFIDTVLFGGDLVQNVIADTNIDWYYNGLSEVPCLLNVVGNHDTYATNSSGNTTFVDKSVTYSKLISPIITTSEIIQPNNAEQESLCYYYKDFYNTIRIIVLDYIHWDTTQRTWLQNTLSDALTNNLQVICATHAPFRPTYFTKLDCSWTKHPFIPSANSSELMYSNIEMAEDVKEFIDNGGKFIIWLIGHAHWDNFYKLNDILGGQLIFQSGASTNQESRIILSNNPEDYTHDLMTYISIDTNNNLIKFYRIGCDHERLGTKYKGAVLNYLEKNVYTSW